MATRQLEMVVRERCKSGTLTVSGAPHLFDRLRATKNMASSISPFNHLLIALVRMRDENFSHSLYKVPGKFLKQGSTAQLSVFNLLLKGLFRDNRILEAAVLVHDKMPRRGCSPDLICYSILMDGFCKIGKIEGAERLTDYMVCKGVEPDIVTYTTLVAGFCKKGQIDKAGKILQFMTSKSNKSNIVGLCKKGLMVYAKYAIYDFQ